MKKISFIFITVFILFSINLHAQITQFTQDPTTYISGLEQLFRQDRNISKSTLKEIDAFLLGEFSTFWSSITDLEKQSIIELSNAM